MQKTPYKNPKKILAQIWRTLKRKISATCCFQLVTLNLAEREALELILSQNIIKLQTTDNQV